MAHEVGFTNTHDDHCRICMPHDVPKGTTVICIHRDHYHHHDDETAEGLVRHVLIGGGGPQPLRPALDAPVDAPAPTLEPAT